MSSADLKIVLLGNKNVGKTALFNRFIYDEFGKTSMTIGAYFAMKKCTIDSRNYNLAIWDTAGEEKFDSLTNYYCRNANGACICYDITSYQTFENLQRWVKKLQQEADKDCFIVIVGTKFDLVEEDPSLRKVDKAEAKRYAQTIDAELFEASAKSGMNVPDVFSHIVSGYVDRVQGKFPEPVAGKFKLGAGKPNGGGGGKDANASSGASQNGAAEPAAAGGKCC